MADYIPLYPGEIFNGCFQIERLVTEGEDLGEGRTATKGQSKYLYWGTDLDTNGRFLCCFATLRDRSQVTPSRNTPKELLT